MQTCIFILRVWVTDSYNQCWDDLRGDLPHLPASPHCQRFLTLYQNQKKLVYVRPSFQLQLQSPLFPAASSYRGANPTTERRELSQANH